MERRDSFIFYRSFYEAVAQLRPKDRAEVVLAICEYALNGREPELTGVPAGFFLLVKPNLDASWRRFESGRKGGRPKTKPKPVQNQTETETEPYRDRDKDRETDRDRETETDRDGGMADGDPAAAVTAAYLDRVSPTLSRRGREELAELANDLGTGVCLRAMDQALDAGKPSWPYVRAILLAKRDQGVRTLADWDAAEAARERRQPGGGGNVFLDMLREEAERG